jgi:hypothetical protein
MPDLVVGSPRVRRQRAFKADHVAADGTRTARAPPRAEVDQHRNLPLAAHGPSTAGITVWL